MTRQSVMKAYSEAVEFISRCQVVISLTPEGQKYVGAVKEQSALRRQSMELTRALAEMRRA